jgi:IS5 family transposase
MIRMLLIGYCLGIRSEQRLCEEVHLNLAYRWFCRLGLEGKVPDHSTFSKNRHGRFRESDLFRHLFEAVVQRCLDEGLVGGEGFAVDASLIQADANKQRSLAASDWRAPDHPPDAPRAVREYLATLDEAAWGAATEVEPKFVSPSGPAAQWTGALRGPAFFAYADNYLIDLKAAVIVDVEASRAVRQAEVGAARTMLERAAERFGLKPERLAADSAYGAAEMLHWLVDEQKIEPHVPVIDKSTREDGTFSRSDFNYDPEADTYPCPEGKTLTTSGRIVNEGTNRLYPGSTFDCGPYPSRSAAVPTRQPAGSRAASMSMQGRSRAH